MLTIAIVQRARRAVVDSDDIAKIANSNKNNAVIAG